MQWFGNCNHSVTFSPPWLQFWWHKYYAFYHSAVCTDSRVVKGMVFMSSYSVRSAVTCSTELAPFLTQANFSFQHRFSKLKRWSLKSGCMSKHFAQLLLAPFPFQTQTQQERSCSVIQVLGFKQRSCKVSPSPLPEPLPCSSQHHVTNFIPYFKKRMNYSSRP